MLKSTRDPSLQATEEYRTHLSRAFDLVLIENGYPLEPNYVIIQDVVTNLSEKNLLHLNVSRLPNISLGDVKVTKY